MRSGEKVGIEKSCSGEGGAHGALLSVHRKVRTGSGGKAGNAQKLFG